MNLLRMLSGKLEESKVYVGKEFNDAEPVINKLDNYVYNSVQNIMMFHNSESAVIS